MAGARECAAEFVPGADDEGDSEDDSDDICKEDFLPGDEEAI
jgi:hypothetical protein